LYPTCKNAGQHSVRSDLPLNQRVGGSIPSRRTNVSEQGKRPWFGIIAGISGLRRRTFSQLPDGT
jgi:hypothetical protein